MFKKPCIFTWFLQGFAPEPKQTVPGLPKKDTRETRAAKEKRTANLKQATKGNKDKTYFSRFVTGYAVLSLRISFIFCFSSYFPSCSSSFLHIVFMLPNK